MNLLDVLVDMNDDVPINLRNELCPFSQVNHVILLHLITASLLFRTHKTRANFLYVVGFFLFFTIVHMNRNFIHITFGSYFRRKVRKFLS